MIPMINISKNDKICWVISKHKEQKTKHKLYIAINMPKKKKGKKVSDRSKTEILKNREEVE